MDISRVYKRSIPHLRVCSGPQQTRLFAWVIALAEISSVEKLKKGQTSNRGPPLFISGALTTELPSQLWRIINANRLFKTLNPSIILYSCHQGTSIYTGDGVGHYREVFTLTKISNVPKFQNVSDPLLGGCEKMRRLRKNGLDRATTKASTYKAKLQPHSLKRSLELCTVENLGPRGSKDNIGKIK